MNRRFGAIAFLACALASTLASPASATERTYPGSRCIEYESPSSPAIWYTGGSAQLGINGPTTFVCPLTRNGLGSGMTSGVSIWLKDPSNLTAVVCKLQSCDSTGVCTSSLWQNTGGPNTGTFQKTFEPIAKYADGYAFIYCNIYASGSSIISYRWDE